MTPDSSRPGVGQTVLFDLDGVLTRRDTFATLVRRRLLGQPWRALLALPALPLLAATASRPRMRGAVARYLVRVALLGADLPSAQGEAAALGREFAQTPDWLLTDGVQRALAHLARGDRVVVVTATELGLARSLLDELGLEGAEVIASRLRGDRYGVRLDPHNYGHRKLLSLRSAGVEQPWDVMYSDSLADLPVLREVRRAVMVTPSGSSPRRLRRMAGETRMAWERWT